jgi:hypothetical protein
MFLNIFISSIVASIINENCELSYYETCVVDTGIDYFSYLYDVNILVDHENYDMYNVNYYGNCGLLSLKSFERHLRLYNEKYKYPGYPAYNYVPQYIVDNHHGNKNIVSNLIMENSEWIKYRQLCAAIITKESEDYVENYVGNYIDCYSPPVQRNKSLIENDKKLYYGEIYTMIHSMITKCNK